MAWGSGETLTFWWTLDHATVPGTTLIPPSWVFTFTIFSTLPTFAIWYSFNFSAAVITVPPTAAASSYQFKTTSLLLLKSHRSWKETSLSRTAHPSSKGQSLASITQLRMIIFDFCLEGVKFDYDVKDLSRNYVNEGVSKTNEVVE